MTRKASSLQLHFPGATLKAPAFRTRKAERPRLGWLLLKVDVNSASARFRCFHFARVLEEQFESVYFTRYQDLKEQIDSLDAIIVVKRLDRTVFDIAALAEYKRKPVFLDLCDDLVHPHYASGADPGQSITALRAIAPVLAGIIVPSAAMAERIEGYLAGSQVTCRCHVIPDIAENSELFEATTKFVTGFAPRTISTMPINSVWQGPAIVASDLKRIVWFGNYGSTHSNFGIFSLKSWLKSLREFHQMVPLELVVVSNSRSVYNALVDKCGFPTRYVPWSGSAVYSELQSADAALLTTGTDDFSAVKSANRIVQALACGVPVIANNSTALAEFEDVILTGNMQRCLDICLRPENQDLIAIKMNDAKRILARYTPETLSRIWSNLLTRAIGKNLIWNANAGRSAVILVLVANDKLDDALLAIKAMNGTPGLDYEMLVSMDLLEANPRFASALHAARCLPRFFSGKLPSFDGELEQCSCVVIGNCGTKFGKAMVDLASKFDVEVVEFREALNRDFSIYSTQEAVDEGTTRAPPGPHPPRMNLDGSVDWAFVIHSNARGWILDAICQEIGSRQPASWQVIGHRTRPPPAKNLFFSHFTLLDSFDIRFPEEIAASKIFLWYTHPREETPASIARSLDLFGRATRVIFTSETNRAVWIERGLPPERATVVLGAADPQLFLGHNRDNGCVGMSSSFYERKNPDLMLEVIKALPHRQFTLLGRNWKRYARFEELQALPNFTYLSAPYRDYPRIYGTFDVFLSISSLEGGPIPLIEAMMCNAVPVASNTGFAHDLITPGQNGFIFDHDASVEMVADLIEKAFALPTDVRSTVEPYDWDRFSAKIVELAQ